MPKHVHLPRRPVLDVAIDYESAFLHVLAVAAATLCQAEPREAITATILAVTAFEAFVNEFAATAFYYGSKRASEAIDELPDAAYRERMLELGQEILMRDREPTLERYDVAWSLLTGNGPVRGQGNRQRVQHLVDLRNAFVHLQPIESEIVLQRTPRPEWFSPTGEWAGLVCSSHPLPPQLQPFRAMLFACDDETLSWVDQVSTPKVAAFACDTALHAAKELVAQNDSETEFHRNLAAYSLAARSELLGNG